MKWKTLRHKGVAFPPEYEYRGLTVKIKGEPFKLNPLQEEMLMAWAKKKDTLYVADEVFQRNFMADLQSVGKLPERFAGITLAEIDWTELHAIADREKTANLSPEEKKKRSAERKAERERLKAEHGTAVIDEIETEIAAYLVEPPGILMGRGDHPLRGRWKERVEPEQVILNLDEDAPVPPLPGAHQWGKIVHEHDSMWVASWHDRLSNKRKYVWLADSSHLRQERDKEKYLKASKLASGLERVRAEIRKGMEYTDPHRRNYDKQVKSLQARIAALDARILRAGEVGDKEGRKKAEDERAAAQKEIERLEKQGERIKAGEMKKRQIAAVCYLIDKLAMRVGDEKDEDEADTVGASTLRVEHVKIDADKIEFDFLGKDSVQWTKSLAIADGESILARNLQEFMQGKQPNEQIFDKIDSTHVNRFLSGIVPGLTAKVFRTYHATTTVRDCLEQNGNLDRAAPTFEKEFTAKLANLQAAITCNHKRTPPKNWEESLNKKEKALEQVRAATPDPARLKEQAAKRAAALEKMRAQQQKLEREGPELLSRKEAALARLQARLQAALEQQAAREQSSADPAALEQRRQEIDKRQAALQKLHAQQKKLEQDGPPRIQQKEAALAKLQAKRESASDKDKAKLDKQVAAAEKELRRLKRDLETRARRLKVSAKKAEAALARAQAGPEQQAAEGEKHLAKMKKEYAAAEKALQKARQDFERKRAQYPERIARAEEELAQAQQAPERAEQEYNERVQKAERQLQLARETRDYNLGTSLKNYIDPRVFKAWGDYVDFDWKRLYTKVLQRKFAWVNQTHMKWTPAGLVETPEQVQSEPERDEVA